jgi:hypothetical protein
LPPGQNGPDSDPDGDGIPNLAEYAAGSDPLVPDAAREMVTRSENGLQMDYVWSNGATDVECIPEWCSDLSLAAWSSTGVPAPVTLGEQNGFRQMRVLFPAAAGTNRMFVRLRVRRL